MKKIILILITICFYVGASAQGIYNDGAYIVNDGNGSYWVVDGGDFTLTSPVSNTEFDNLTIKDDASLTLASPSSVSFMTVDGTFTIESGGSFTVESGSSLITNGTITASGSSITFERTISGNDDWHMLSAPASVSISSETTAQDFSPGGDDDFYAWYEPSPGIWVNYKTIDPDQDPKFADAIINNGDLFNPGKGYLVSYLSPSTKEFVGLPNAQDITFTLSYSSSKNSDWVYARGWNLMGNPFSSSYNWQVGTDDNLFQDVYAYVYDQNEKDYIYIGGEGGYPPDIAPKQGFFVLAKSGVNGSQYTFDTDNRVHDGANPFRKNSTVENEYLTLEIEGNEYSNKLTICHNPESGYERDRYDAIKMFSFNNQVPSIYSFSTDGVMLAINSMPEIIGKPVDLGFRIPLEDTYTLSLTKIPSQLSGTPIYLEDKLHDEWTQIDNQSVSFVASAGDLDDRFVLHMGVVGLEETITTPNPIQVYFNDNGINIINNKNLNGEVTVVNILGRQIASFKLEGNVSQSFALNVPQGVYVVYLQTNDGNVYSEKVLIK